MMIDETLLVVDYCYFLENESNSGSALYAIEIMVRYIAIQNTIFMENTGADCVIGGMYTTFIFAYSNVTNNTIKAISFTKNSNLTLSACFFAFQQCSTSSKGCFITLTLNSFIIIYGAVVYDVVSESEGGFIYLESSNLTIVLLTVMQVLATQGACVEGTKYSDVIIQNSSFQYYSPDCMYFSDSKIMMQNVNISDSIYALAVMSNPDLTGASVITMINCPLIVISQLQINNNMGITDYGGALFIQMQDLDNPMSIISDSTFYANSAGQWGGAIYINNQNLTLLGNTFMNNNAQYGGAIYFDCQGNEIFFPPNLKFLKILHSQIVIILIM